MAEPLAEGFPAPSAVTVLDAPFPRVVFGVGAVDRVGGEVSRLGATAVLLIVDGAALAAGDAIAAALGGRLAGRIREVVQHVPVAVADAAVEQARATRADLVVSVGGGSATGLGKAVALSTGLPLLAVPSTYAGSEMTPVWGLTSTVDGASAKRTGRDERVRPKVVVYDPALTASMPVGLSAASGLNAMAHLMAALFATGASPIVAAVAEEGVRVLAGALPRVAAAPVDLAARSDALYGAWLAGWSFGATGSGLHHKLCHVLGGSYDLPHAQTHAVMLPHTTAFLAPAAVGAAARVSRALGGVDAVEGLAALGRSLGVPASLTELGFDPARIDDVARAVVAARPNSPRPVDIDGVREVMRAACNP
jgi:maleylacetate reductase